MAREMKDSGVEWIGEIPREWRIEKLKNIGLFSSSGIDKKINENEELVKIINYIDVYRNKTFELKNDNYMIVSAPKEKIEKHCVKKGDLIFTPSSETQDEIGISSLIKEDLINTAFSYHVLRFQFKENIHDNFKKYMCNNQHLYQYFSKCAVGTIRKTLNRNDFNSALVFIPPLEEQEKIANFLDKKVSDIDLIIEKTKITIEDYKKYKQSIITEVVTKGINPNVEMKDSGIEWIGEIPREWEVAKLKQISYIRARLGWKGLKAEEYTEDGYMFLSAFNIIDSKLNFSETNFINSYRYEESPEIKLKINDVLIVKDGAGIGKCACVEYLPQEATINGSIALISTCEDVKGKFLYYYFLTKIIQKYVDRLKDGMGVPHLFQRDIKEIKIPFPNVEQQQQIIEYLDKKTSEIDTLIAKKEALITELEEYKKSLIYECVTGKKEII